MKLKNKRISQEFISQLSDWEILSVVIHCNNLLKRESVLFSEEFNDICFFFFDEDVDFTHDTLSSIKEIYVNEYLKRRLN
jgi:hypothetical protein